MATPESTRAFLTSLAPGARVAVLARADLRADALPAVHALRQADGALAAVAAVPALAAALRAFKRVCVVISSSILHPRSLFPNYACSLQYSFS